MVPDHGSEKSWMVRLCGKRVLRRCVSFHVSPGSGPASAFAVPAQDVVSLGIFIFSHLDRARKNRALARPAR